MAIAYESNTDLAFDTSVLRKAAKEYEGVAEELRGMASKLDGLLLEMKGGKTVKTKKGAWSTPAAKAFYEMAGDNWTDNILKYATLLDTLASILRKSSNKYDDLADNYIATTKVQL